MTAQVFTPVALLEPSRAILAVEQHRGIAAAIGAGDRRSAEHLARAHIRTTIERINKHTAPAPPVPRPISNR